MKSVLPIFGLVILSMVFVLGAVMFGEAMKASDYEASNSTGNMTENTNQTLTISAVETTWFAGLGILVLLLTLGLIFFRFFVK